MSAAALRARLSEALAAIAGRTDAHGRCLILSGGVDTCAILACAKEIGVGFAAAITVITGSDAPDREFAVAAAKEHSLPHHVVTVNAAPIAWIYYSTGV